ncbi:hypothetical protein [Acidovorax sp. SUPP3334]|uniref:hypothetical protein n=1 Tax=Acidovorax sp. SUPP3334 TaxID=2920881 RepID=UPI0023DE4D93|nr:hypothetical protein [Acidovorax sp. SUPP3334]GKT27142.1 hypothetical protein AVHM3334_22860 [Acidovorax sp. SUPP3334]
MLIILDEDSVRFSDSKLSNNVFAHVYLRCDSGECFPECGWDDFAQVVLSWWTDGATRFLKYGDEEIFRFMDGDFYFKIEGVLHKDVQISWFEKSKIIKTQQLDFSQFVSSLLVAGNKLARKLQEIEVDKKITDDFVRCQNNLRKLLKSQI